MLFSLTRWQHLDKLAQEKEEEEESSSWSNKYDCTVDQELAADALFSLTRWQHLDNLA